jgi:hypothetical protein
MSDVSTSIRQFVDALKGVGQLTVGIIVNGIRIASDTGKIEFGKTRDVNLYRGGADTLVTDDYLFVKAILGSTAIAARAYASGNVSHATNGAWQVVLFDSENYDLATLHSTTTNTGRLTTTIAGIYQVEACVTWAANATGGRAVKIVNNLGTTYAYKHHTADAGLTTVQELSTQISLAANGYVELSGFQDSGGALNMTGGEGQLWFAMARIA